MTSLALIPLDDRPVNYDHPWWLGRAAGIDVRRPPRGWLGGPGRQADRAALGSWLLDQARSVDGVVLAIDTLAYGGLIPSRQSTETLDAVMAALEPVRTLRATVPDLPILAASVLMRVDRGGAAEEERPYWAEHGRSLFRLSYLDDKADRGEASDAELAELRVLSGQVPAAVVTDYRGARARNHGLNARMLDWVADHTLDQLIVAQDDTVAFGWNTAEARSLRADLQRRGLADRAIVYPGADEVGSLLVAAFACRRAGLTPTVWTRYASATGADARTAFEDRPLGALVQAHLAPLGGWVAASPEAADLVLAINAPAESQAEAWLQLAVLEPDRVTVPLSDASGEALRATRREMATVCRDVDELARAVAGEVAADRPVAVVDVAFANGADLALAERLAARVPLARLAAYGAWNTAGNTLGAALAQGVIEALARRGHRTDDMIAGQIGALAIHWLDDHVFQARVRTEMLLEDLPALGLAPSFHRLPDEVLPEVEARLSERLAPHVAWLEQALRTTLLTTEPPRRVLSLGIEPPTLPWRRVFEVAITPRVRIG